jgi:hypothetical protein
MILGAVLFVAILACAISAHYVIAALLLAVALPYWWMGSRE